MCAAVSRRRIAKSSRDIAESLREMCWFAPDVAAEASSGTQCERVEGRFGFCRLPIFWTIVKLCTSFKQIAKTVFSFLGEEIGSSPARLPYRAAIPLCQHPLKR
jgi:hypothetical protein